MKLFLLAPMYQQHLSKYTRFKATAPSNRIKGSKYQLNNYIFINKSVYHLNFKVGLH